MNKKKFEKEKERIQESPELKELMAPEEVNLFQIKKRMRKLDRFLEKLQKRMQIHSSRLEREINPSLNNKELVKKGEEMLAKNKNNKEQYDA